MAFELPDVDQLSYQQMVDDMLRRIPQYSKQWTDFNDSDPGITVLQLLAWLDESILYQANRIPLQTEQNFLRWVLGLASSTDQTPYSKAALANFDVDFLALRDVLAHVEQGGLKKSADLQSAVLTYIGKPYLALTLENVELLAKQSNGMILAQAPPGGLLVQQAYARDGDQATLVYVLDDAAVRYRTTILPPPGAAPLRKVVLYQPGDDRTRRDILIKQVATYLAPRVLLGSQVLVRPAQRTDINLTLTVRCAPNIRLEVVCDTLMAMLLRYFVPASGGPQGKGWAYDQAPVDDDIRQRIFAVGGIVAIDAFSLNTIPTPQLNRLGELGVNTLLADLPPGAPALFYRGLPRLRCLDVTLIGDQR
jgi:hypothetical protein